jgi:hypothetical protein
MKKNNKVPLCILDLTHSFFLYTLIAHFSFLAINATAILLNIQPIVSIEMTIIFSFIFGGYMTFLKYKK